MEFGGQDFKDLLKQPRILAVPSQPWNEELASNSSINCADADLVDPKH